MSVLGSESTSAAAGGVGAEEKSARRKVIVLGVPYGSDAEALRGALCSYGTVEDVYIMRDKMTQRSRGFGFVQFDGEAAAAAAVAASQRKEIRLGERDLDVQLATEKGEGGQSKRALGRAVHRLFVGKIPSSVGEAELREHFSKFGELEDCYMPRKGGGASDGHRGFAFVSFADPAAAQEVQQAKQHTLAGQALVISHAVPKGRGGRGAGYGSFLGPAPGHQGYYRHPHFAMRHPVSAGSMSYGYLPYGYPPYGAFPAPAPHGPHAYGAYGQPVPGVPAHGHTGGQASARGGGRRRGQSQQAHVVAHNNRVFVGKLNFQTTSEFGNVEDVYLPPDRSTGRNKGFGFVTYADPGTAAMVISRGSLVVDGRPVVLDSAWKRVEGQAAVPATSHADSGAVVVGAGGGGAAAADVLDESNEGGSRPDGRPARGELAAAPNVSSAAAAATDGSARPVARAPVPSPVPAALPARSNGDRGPPPPAASAASVSAHGERSTAASVAMSMAMASFPPAPGVPMSLGAPSQQPGLGMQQYPTFPAGQVQAQAAAFPQQPQLYGAGFGAAGAAQRPQRR